MSQPGIKRRVVASLLAGAFALSPVLLSGFGPLAVSAHAAGTVVHKYSLGSKVTLTTYHFATGPEEIRVLTIAQGGGAFDVAPAGAAFGAYVKPSTIASNANENGTGTGPALAGTNGDFATSGMPLHLEQVDGEVWSSALSPSPRFAINGDGSKAWIGNSELSMSATANGVKDPIDHWNAGPPAANQLTAYSQVGGSSQKPPSNGTDSYCAVRLLPTSSPQWSDVGRSGVTRTYKVDTGLNTSPCPKTAMTLGSDPGAVVLASKDAGTGGAFLNSLHVNDVVSLTTRSLGWPGVVDSIGGTPILVKNGVNVGPSTGHNYIYNNNPRTSIGLNAACSDNDVTTTCKIFIVTVDGRRTGWSAGWKMNQLGNFFAKTLHADYALNMDGGGGTVMWANQSTTQFAPCIKSAAAGCLVSKPSDGGGERVAVVAMVALPGADLGLPKSLR
jgi:hypothetical protein